MWAASDGAVGLASSLSCRLSKRITMPHPHDRSCESRPLQTALGMSSSFASMCSPISLQPSTATTSGSARGRCTTTRSLVSIRIATAVGSRARTPPTHLCHRGALVRDRESHIRIGVRIVGCGTDPPKCLGAETFLVGHEAAQGLGAPVGGQCESNPLTGEWWSLPAGGRCTGAQTPEGGHCTWSATRTKTIDSKCLLDRHGFKEACAADGRAPFLHASKVFLQAMAEDDIAKGGCPPLNITLGA